MSLGVSGWLGRVANLGGKIRHTEVRTGASSMTMITTKAMTTAGNAAAETARPVRTRARSQSCR